MYKINLKLDTIITATIIFILTFIYDRMNKPHAFCSIIKIVTENIGRINNSSYRV